MYQYLFVLGRKWEISVQEIKAVFQDSKITETSPTYLILETQKKLDAQKEINRLGGIIKIALIISQMEEKSLIKTIADFLEEKYKEESKIKYALNILNFPLRNLARYLLDLKKMLKKNGKSSRFINKNFQNPALAILREEGFLRGKGSEIILAQNSGKFWIAETEAIQDIEKYSLRDYQKPFRDAQMGMLPPKLAQILINLAELKANQTLWDPFCGSGTILMEGLLQGIQVVGSDIQKENVEGANQNLWWFCQNFDLPKNYKIFAQDATKPLREKIQFDAVVCEGYLGKPKQFLPEIGTLKKEINFLENLYTEFFQNLKTFFKPNGFIVIAVPCFRDKQNYIFLENLLEKIKRMGYSPSALSETKRGSLIYDRKDQTVAREILKFRFIPL